MEVRHTSTTEQRLVPRSHSLSRQEFIELVREEIESTRRYLASIREELLGSDARLRGHAMVELLELTRRVFCTFGNELLDRRNKAHLQNWLQQSSFEKYSISVEPGKINLGVFPQTRDPDNFIAKLACIDALLEIIDAA